MSRAWPTGVLEVRAVIEQAVDDALKYAFVDAKLRRIKTDAVPFEVLLRAVEKRLGATQYEELEVLDVIWSGFGRTWLPGRALNQAGLDFIHLTQEGRRDVTGPMTPDGLQTFFGPGGRP